MFWRFGGYTGHSTLNSILDKSDITVEELLDEGDLIQELKQQNSKLVEFLRGEPVLERLLDLLIADGASTEADRQKQKEGRQQPQEHDLEREKGAGLSFFTKGKGRARSKSVAKKEVDGEMDQDKKEARRKKYAYMACEVLSSEVWSITEALMGQQDHLRRLWQYVHRPPPLDPLQASYFTKVNEALLDKKTEGMLAFLKSLEDVVPAMLQHVDCPTVMDLLLKIISLEKHDGGTGIVDWLQQHNIIPLLLGYISPEHDPATQTSAGDFLKAIITISANATTQDQSVIGPNELTRQLVSDSCIERLIANMLQGGNPLTVGVGIVIEVIRKNNSDYDLDNQAGPEPKTSDPIYLGTLLRQFANHVPDFMKHIRSPRFKKPDLEVAFGGKIEPLGFDRFKTCELMAELLHCSNMGLLNEKGGEDCMRKRDAERERLKLEGKLATTKSSNTLGMETGIEEEFGSSVDSHGFHHARKPSSDEDPGRIAGDKHPLDLHNAMDEDGFEKVNAPPDELPDEVTFDELAERTEISNSSATETAEQGYNASNPPTEHGDVPLPLSPNKMGPLLSHNDTNPAADLQAAAAGHDGSLSLSDDDDAVLTELGEEPKESDSDGPSELDKALQRAEHPEDRPAPLFAKKEPGVSDPDSDPDSPSSTKANIDASVETLQRDAEVLPNSGRPPYETEIDGSPVVGDFLKIQFVDHKVVPTILDFFFRFPWNNFLHNVVYDVVQQVFNGTLDRGYNRALAFDLFSPTDSGGTEQTKAIGLASTKDITDRILDGQEASAVSQKTRGMRLGYMGHLTLIAEEVCKFGIRQPVECLDQNVLDRVNREAWTSYVEGTLAETRDKDHSVLGGGRPQDGIGNRPPGGAFGLSTGASAALQNAGIAPQESHPLMADEGAGSGFEANVGTLFYGFTTEAEEIEMMRLAEGLRGNSDRENVVDADEQATQTFHASPVSVAETGVDAPSIPPPLHIPPSRARRQLAARLARKKADVDTEDPDAADRIAVAASATLLPETDAGSGPATERVVPETDGESEGRGLSVDELSSQFEGLQDDSSDEDESGTRAPRVRAARVRIPLDDEAEEQHVSHSPFEDPDDESSSEDDVLPEIRPRRAN